MALMRSHDSCITESYMFCEPWKLLTRVIIHSFQLKKTNHERSNRTGIICRSVFYANMGKHQSMESTKRSKTVSNLILLNQIQTVIV